MGSEKLFYILQVLDLMTTLRKNNTGYDLKQLFIGAEGTLGKLRFSKYLPLVSSAFSMSNGIFHTCCRDCHQSGYSNSPKVET